MSLVIHISYAAYILINLNTCFLKYLEIKEILTKKNVSQELFFFNFNIRLCRSFAWLWNKYGNQVIKDVGKRPWVSNLEKEMLASGKTQNKV